MRVQQRFVQRHIVRIGDRLVAAFGFRAEGHDQRLAVQLFGDRRPQCGELAGVERDIQEVDAEFGDISLRARPDRASLRDRLVSRRARDWHDRLETAFADDDIADLDGT